MILRACHVLKLKAVQSHTAKRKTGLLSRTFFKKEINQVSDLSLKRYLKQLRSDLGPCIIADIGMSKQENPISGLIQI